MPAQSPIIR